MKIQRTDQESKQQKARLEAQLQEANEQLEDQVMNHVVDMRIEGLDKISEQLQENYDKFVKELQTNLDRAVDVVNTTAVNISDSIDTTNNILESLLDSFHEGLDFKHIGAEYFTSDNIDTTKSNSYEAPEIDDSRVYVTPQGTFSRVNSPKSITPEYEVSYRFAVENYLKSIEESAKKLTDGVTPKVAYGNAEVGSLITINVEGNLDESVIPHIREIGEKLMNDRSFTKRMQIQVNQTNAKELRKTGA